MIEVYGLSDRVTVFSYVVGLPQISVYFVDYSTSFFVVIYMKSVEIPVECH